MIAYLRAVIVGTGCGASCYLTTGNGYLTAVVASVGTIAMLHLDSPSGKA